jgi:PRTRC genetic system protein E
MDFFKQMFELADGIDMTIKLKRVNDQLMVTILPDSAKNVRPLLFTAPPGDIDMQFFELIKKPMEATKALINNVAEYEEDVKKAVEENSKKKDTANKAFKKDDRQKQNNDNKRLQNAKSQVSSQVSSQVGPVTETKDEDTVLPPAPKPVPVQTTLL